MTVTGKNISFEFDPINQFFEATAFGEKWSWADKPYFTDCKSQKIYLNKFDCDTKYADTEIYKEIDCEYTNITDQNGNKLCFTMSTSILLNKANDELEFRVKLDGDQKNQIFSVNYPAPFELNAEENRGYTVYPIVQGALIPARWNYKIDSYNGCVFESGASCMAFYGQRRNNVGYTAIYNTPYDTLSILDHTPGGDTLVRPSFVESLGYMAHERSITFIFENNCDYVKMAKNYRKHLIKTGEFVSLKEKAQKAPSIEKMYGAPFVHSTTVQNFDPDSSYYSHDYPERNHIVVTFEQRLAQLRKNKALGVDNTYIHLDGWGVCGYDNNHPDLFPINEEAGGTEMLKKLVDFCHDSDYLIILHDNYRDYYYSAQTFDFKKAMVNCMGEHPFCSIWAGGKQSLLCTSYAIDYVKRNYDEFERLGVNIDGAYFDVFGAVSPDECYSPDHPMTRKQCAEYRCECFDELLSRRMIPSTECISGCIVKSIATCHFGGYLYLYNLGEHKPEEFGVPLPLFNLVYHDSVIIPFDINVDSADNEAQKKFGNNFLHAILNGGTVYQREAYSEKSISQYNEKVKPVTELHKLVADKEMLSHEFVDGYSLQRTIFEGGIEVTVDFAKGTYEVKAN